MPQRTAEFDVTTPPFLSTDDSNNFGSEEWEGWMKWDTLADQSSLKSSDLSPPSLNFNSSSNSNGSTSPSEFDGLPQIEFSPVYSLPEPEKPAAPSKKRKSSAMSSGTTTTRQPRGQKISHNVIEKRYRSNLNDKIAKLRDSVPELRTATPTVKKRNTKGASRDSDESEDEGAGLKFNKATVLTKATEYIAQLERQNQRLQSELSSVRSRGGNFDKLRNPPAISTGTAVPIIAPPTQPRKPIVKPTPTLDLSDTVDPMGMIQVPDQYRRYREANATTEHYGHSFPSSVPLDDCFSGSSDPVQGMIPLAEDFRRMREEGASQAHYAPEAPSYYGSYVSPQDTVFENVDADEATTRWPRSKAMSRVLVGSLVGLMFMESFSEAEAADSEQDGKLSARGLFSLPLELRTESRGFRAQIRQRIITFWNSPAAGRAGHILLISALFMAVVFAIFVYLAPRGSKNVREGPFYEQPVQSSTEEEETATTSEEEQVSETTNSTAKESVAKSVTVHPLKRPVEGKQPVTLVRLALERVVNEWCGLNWFRSHHLDEEAFARAGHKILPDETKDWPGLQSVVPKLLAKSW